MNELSIYDKAITHESIESIWNTVRRTCKNKKAIFQYSLNQNTYNEKTYQILKNRSYKPYTYQ